MSQASGHQRQQHQPRPPSQAPPRGGGPSSSSSVAGGGSGSAGRRPNEKDAKPPKGEQSWIFPIDKVFKCPSVEEGLLFQDFANYKSRAYDLIKLFVEKIPTSTTLVTTAMTLLHRFYMYQSMQTFHWVSLAQACLFAACKMEDRFIRAETLLQRMERILQRVFKLPEKKLDTQAKEYWDKRETLIMHERILLQTVGFDFPRTNVNATVLEIVKQLIRNGLLAKEAGKELSRISWSWSTATYAHPDLHLTCHRELIALGLVYSAVHTQNVPIPLKDGKSFWEICSPHFPVTEHQLRMISGRLYRFFAKHKHLLKDTPPANPETFRSGSSRPQTPRPGSSHTTQPNSPAPSAPTPTTATTDAETTSSSTPQPATQAQAPAPPSASTAVTTSATTTSVAVTTTSASVSSASTTAEGSVASVTAATVTATTRTTARTLPAQETSAQGETEGSGEPSTKRPHMAPAPPPSSSGPAA